MKRLAPIPKSELESYWGIWEADAEDLIGQLLPYIDMPLLVDELLNCVPPVEAPRFANHWHSSGDLKYGTCLRKTAYSLKHIPPTDLHAGEAHKISDALSQERGNIIHRHYQAAMEKAGLALRLADGRWATEVDLDESTVAAEMWVPFQDLFISGRIDNLVDWRGYRWVLDIKTVEKEKAAADNIWWPNSVLDYFRQVAYYNRNLHIDGQYLDYGLVLVIFRDAPGTGKLYACEYNPKVIDYSLLRIEEANTRLANDDLPDREPSESFCTLRCEYFSHCKPVFPPKKAYKR